MEYVEIVEGADCFDCALSEESDFACNLRPQ
jgi:hypothetical protein